ncbi:uncharacterized protein LOC128999177 [Macrosteles quadrilineatus]|uniref:uncharacterized protein LOC128982180 n=1 Tax=Macrosteles quadrilineatus TaxID=74068 RepID=UPI0023E130A4|nr:uncharacterized protein LOC128982180 [Macrosteles quadrilineatus]XP_054281552.1 uncharacterized protein LOC128999177 [Macrosteles quadrilineatus]
MLATLLLVLHLLQLCAGSCYFSAELQGEYLMQTITITSGAQTQIQYSVVKITAEAIPMWGLCHQREGDNVILNDSFNGTACIRCFHLKLHSPNVLQVHTCPTCLDQCYLTEEAARNTCPKGDDLASGRHKEINLFRTREIGGGSIRKMFCPIAGRYKFTYNLYNQTDNRVECSPSVSQLENCPDRTGGPGLEVHFQGCAHQYNEMTFDCLGDWPGPNGQRFLALQETNVPATGERPLYRCALYKEDEQRGSIMMAFSSDSTCTSDLYNASYGHMTWNLTAIPSVHWPSVVINSKCSFPYWSQGKWEHLNIDFNSLTYKDHYSYNAYTMRCAQAVNEERFVVFSKNGCGEEVYKCIKMKLRSGNVLEFQLGLTSSIFFNTSLCSDSNFLGNIWVTQARLEGRQVSPCPVTGDYTGFITNDSGLCARMASDQLHPEIMYFTVSDCEQQEVYEEREYQCLGQWEEDGVTYTYTQRRDFGSYECFVGSILSNNEIYIKEAGEHCGRGIDPLRTGMKLQVRGGAKLADPNPPTTPPATSWFVTKRPSIPTKPWKPITGAPPRQSGATRATPLIVCVLVTVVALTLT